MKNFGLLSVALLLSIGCQNASQDTKISEELAAADKPAQPKSLVIYSGRSQVLVGGLVEAFEKKTGIKVDVRYEKSTQTLANRIATESDKTEADIFFAQDSGYLGALAAKKLLKPLSPELVSAVPLTHRGLDNRWVATSGRARVLVYDPKTVQPQDLPKSLADLGDAKWKGKLGWAPGNASFQAHVSALRHLWGEEKTRVWMQNVIQEASPKIYPKNSPQVRGVSNGEIQVGWVNHYYLHKLQATNPELSAANYSFSNDKDAGNLMMLSGIGILTASDNSEAATQFVSFLLEKEQQAYFTNEVFEYPVREDVPLNPSLPDIRDRLVQIDQTHLADLAPTLQLLRDLQLQ
jgi:iron(III) transport system substrate-binding protein